MTSRGIGVYIWFAQHDEAAQLAWRLRGGQVFQAMAKQRLTPFNARIRLPSSTGLKMPGTYGGRGNVVFADLSILVDNPDLYDQLVALGCVLVVDLHFPLPSPEHILAVQPGRNDTDRDAALDEEAREHWREPDRINRAWQILREADVVTVCREEWMPDQLKQWQGRTAIVLLDVEESVLDTAVDFYRQWWETVSEVLFTVTGWRRLVGRTYFRRVLLPMLERDLRRQLVAQ